MIELVIENSSGIYNITELTSKISFTDKLNDGCSKLEFSHIKKDLIITNGTFVSFTYEALSFYGVVFKVGRDAKGEISVVAYDQLRYAKAKDTIISKGETITSHVKKMCSYLGLVSDQNLLDTKYVLATEPKDNKTWLDIIYEDIKDTLTATGRYYMVRDEYRKICIRNLEEMRLDLVLGDESLVYDYSYEKSIDDETYNVVKLVSDDKKAGKSLVYVADDKSSVTKYGLLQYFEVADKGMNTSQMKLKAEILLKLYNRETESLTLSCLGKSEVRAGCGIFADISDLGMQKWLVVKSVTHEFLPVHTMSVEVML